MDLDIDRGNVIEELDPRMKLLLVVVFTAFTFLSPDNFVLMLNYILILILFFSSRLYLKGLKVVLYIMALTLVAEAGELIQNEQFRNVFCMIFQFLQRISAFVIMGIWMASRLKVGDFVTAIENMHMPKGITITMAVTFRYMPTVRQEFCYIKNTMRLRGIGFNFKNVIICPLKTIEYSIVPLVIRCFTIADELAASAMTRGLDLETKRVSYHEVKIKTSDVLITLLFIAAIVSASVFGSKLKGEFV